MICKPTEAPTRRRQHERRAAIRMERVDASAPSATTALVLDRLYADHVRDLERRFAGILAVGGWDAAVIHSGSLVKRSVYDDQHWPLRVCPHFQHWLPLAEPEA